MQTPLTNIYGTKTSDGAKILDAIFISLFFLSICWAVFVMDEYLGYRMNQYGMFPRDLEGLRGIFTMHFIHGNLEHIWHNTLGFLVLNSFLFYFYRTISIRVFLFTFFVSGIMLWLIGRPTYHIGASMLLYAQFSFLFFSGLIRKNPQMMRVSLIVALYYGSLVWYLFPIDPKVSWEGHLSGFLAGIIAVFAYRKVGPQRKVYQYELEPDEEEVEELTSSTSPASPTLEYPQTHHPLPPESKSQRD
ncbi:MAG: rhomboid family intramembrane serine protease [Flavobacteriales bacterium]|jgi:membrane associated rhomboid family serine protease